MIPLQHIAAYVDCCKAYITIFYFCCFRCNIMPLTGVINLCFYTECGISTASRPTSLRDVEVP